MNWNHVNFLLPPKGPVYRGLTVTVIDIMVTVSGSIKDRRTESLPLTLTLSLTLTVAHYYDLVCLPTCPPFLKVAQ